MPRFKTILSPIFKYTEDILSNSLAAAVKTELILTNSREQIMQKNKQIKNLLFEAGKVNSLVDSSKLYWNFLFEGKTKAELVNYRRKIRDIDFPNKNWSAVQRNKEYFWALSEGAHWLLEQLEHYFGHAKKAILRKKSNNVANGIVYAVLCAWLISCDQIYSFN